ncbi:tetraspanin-9 [Ischnura elegans]|uniref:tetraspanin-9 n=1 Tax=Ischnura elegans TaxID=197161 RepID=UPI001ED89671|nr:tetraspanin-9 [Ischnura elegans]
MGRSGYTCVRHTFCSINVLLWLMGCGVLGVGVWLHLAHGGYASLAPQFAVASADAILITAGVVAFVVAFFGCCGAWFQSRCMLITYFSLVVFMFLVEFLLATVAFVFRESLGRTLRDELKYGIEHHYNDSQSAPNGLHHIWNHIHNEFHCCGVNNYEDWYDINAWSGEKFVPNSCCLEIYRNITDCGQSGNPDEWYSKGCAEQVQMWFVQRLHVVGTVGLVVAFIQLFGLISSMLLFCTVRHRRSTPTYKSYDHTH